MVVVDKDEDEETKVCDADEDADDEEGCRCVMNVVEEVVMAMTEARSI